MRAELEEERYKEVSALREELEREKTTAVAGTVQQYLASGHVMEGDATGEESVTPFAAEKDSDDVQRQQQVDALNAVLPNDGRGTLLALLEAIDQAHEAELQIEGARKGKESSEDQIAEREAQWAVRLAVAVEACRKEEAAANEAAVAQLKLHHSEEMENALRACRRAEERLKDLEGQHALDIERVLQEQEQVRKVEVEQLKKEQEALCQQVRQLQVGSQDPNVGQDLLFEWLQASQETSESDLTPQHQDKASKMVSTQKQDVKHHLRSEYEVKLLSLQGEVETLQEKLQLEHVSLEANFQQRLEEDALVKESRHREEVASIKADLEQRMREADQQHAQEVERLTRELHRQQESEDAHRELLQAHEQEKAKILAQHERDMQEIKAVYSMQLQAAASYDPTSLSGPESDQHAQYLHKELELQRQRMERQHESDLKLLEQTLRDESLIDQERLRARLEEEHTEQLAQVHTDSALKNVVQIEQISQQLLAEKQRALSELEADLEARHQQRVDRVKEVCEERVGQWQSEVESARSQYQSKLAELEAAMARECESQLAAVRERQSKSWSEQEERLRQEHQQHVDEVVADCSREKKEALDHLRMAMEEARELERVATRERHNQNTEQLRRELESAHQRELVAVQENSQHSHSTMREQHAQQLEEMRQKLLTESSTHLQAVTEELQAVHRTELASIQSEREVEAETQQERMTQLREELEEKHQLDIEQVHCVYTYNTAWPVCTSICVQAHPCCVG